MIKDSIWRSADCSRFHDHTLAPEGYIQWHAWAKRMNRTHRQIKCAGCGLWAIWIPRKNRSADGNSGNQK
jgi:hypothetical protein